MTSIAYRYGVMASDSLVVRGGERNGIATKIFKLRSAEQQVLIGTSGNVAEWQRAVEFLQHSFKASGQLTRQLPHKLESSCVLAVIKPRKGKIKFWEWNEADYACEIQPINKAVSSGSGALICSAAMMAGATAPDAIRIACKLDTGSGGAIQVLRFD